MQQEPIRELSHQLLAQKLLTRYEECPICIQTTDTDSIHRLAFAAFRVNGFSRRNILEFGTDSGETTLYCSELFPEAKIFTVELPDNDPIYLKWHPESPAALRPNVAKRLVRPTLRLTTAYLLEEDLPNFRSDLARCGPLFPEVAWDHFFGMTAVQQVGV
jgi:hypothetical protein